jgi:hypothetical protein
MFGETGSDSPTLVTGIFCEPFSAANAIAALLRRGFADHDIHAVGVLEGHAPGCQRVLACDWPAERPRCHDVRRKPATYDRILKNIAGSQVNMHGTITRPMLERPRYIEEYISFWNARPEIFAFGSVFTLPRRTNTPLKC